MAAIEVSSIGNVDSLHMTDDAPIPALASTQVMVSNHYAGLNFHDTYTRSGLYPLSLPFVVGCEGGGVVTEVGSDVSDVSIGDRVVYLQEGENGSYSEYSNVEASRCIPVPDDIDLDVATATAVQGLTAHYLVNDSYNISPGDWVLIHAAAGGTGQILVQMAKNKGANVIGVCGSEEKRDVALSRGCDHVIVTANVDFSEIPNVVRRIITEDSASPTIIPSNYGPINTNDGVHCVFDSIGKASAISSLESLRPRGTAVLFGNASGAPPDIPPLMLSKLGSLKMTRPKLHDFIATKQEVVDRSRDVFDSVRKKEVEIAIQEKIPFTQDGVRRGTKLLENRGTVGKVLFDIKRRQFSTAARVVATEFPEPTSVTHAYELQKDVVARMDSKPVGYKIAATSKMAQDSVQVSEPFFGSLLENTTLTNLEGNVKISLENLNLPSNGFVIIEPEIAFKIGNDVQDPGAAKSIDDVLPYIASVSGSIELVSSRYDVNDAADFKVAGGLNLIADNACHGALLTTKFQDLDVASIRSLDTLPVTLEHLNSTLTSTGDGSKVLGHPLNPLLWLFQNAARHGREITKGDIISTGVCIDLLVMVKRGDKVTIDWGGRGELGSLIIDFE